MSRRTSTRRKVAARKKSKKAVVKDKHVGVKHTHTRTVNAPKGW